MWDSNRNFLPVAKLADLIKHNPKYDPNKPVRLQVCNAGKVLQLNVPSLGQQLADVLGSTVIAATTGIIIDDQGNTRLPPWGRYIVYTPK
jgi:hypothetical protein